MRSSTQLPMITKDLSTSSQNWILIKNINDAEDWRIYDSAMDPHNPQIQFIKASSDQTEFTSSGIDFLSTGFKCRDGNNGFNSTDTFMYMAMADIAGNRDNPPVYTYSPAFKGDN